MRIEFRKAIPPHHTPIADADTPWDGPANVARLRNGETAAYYRKMFAWVDPEANPNTKAAYKFPHHMVDEEGEIGAANVRACIAVIAALNGARGGAKIPEGDRPGVYRHVATHLRDAGIKPPKLKQPKRAGAEGVEYRAFQTDMRIVELRTAVDARVEGGLPRISGHAAVFDTLSVSLGFYREKIARGAFRKTIERDDIRALWNHDVNYVLGRTRSGTLKLYEDEKGLAVEIIPPNTQWARDLLEVIRRGDVDQMSFAFEAIEEEWEGDANDLIRVLKEVKLYDVSPVTFPAYPATDVYVRCMSDECFLDEYREYFWDEHTVSAKNTSTKLAILRKRLEIAEKEV